MSSEAYRKKACYKIPDIVDNAEALTAESKCLLTENARLRQLMGLMQENVELRDTLKDHKRTIECLSSPGRSKEGSQDSRDRQQFLDPCPSPDSEKMKQCQHCVGEIAFQLDRRILRSVFSEQRLYGFQVANIKDKIKQVTTCSQTGKVNEELRFEMMDRYYHLMDQLKRLGYDRKVHPYFTEYLVNTYGIMKDNMAIGPEDLSSLNDPQFLSSMITKCMYSDKVKDILIILDCLVYLAKKDGSSILRPLTAEKSFIYNRPIFPST